MSFLDLIDDNLGFKTENGRGYTLPQLDYNRLTPPNWIVLDGKTLDCDPRCYQRFYFERRQLMREGRLYWGMLVQANNVLFKPGDEDCPALAIYSRDTPGDNLDELGRIASEIFELKNTKPTNDELKQTADLVTDERAVCAHFPLPAALTGGREVFMTDLLVHRKHLPVPYLQETWFPLLVLPEQCRHVMIVPAAYWPEDLLEMWR